MQDCPLPAPAEAVALPPAPPCLEIARRAAAVDSPGALQAWWQGVAACWWPGARLALWALDASGPSGPAQWLQADTAAAAAAVATPADPQDAAAWALRLHRAWLAAGCRPCRVAPEAGADAGGAGRSEALVHGLRGRRLHAVLAPAAGASPAALELLAPWLEVACSGAGLGLRQAMAVATLRSPAAGVVLPIAAGAAAAST